MRRYSIIIKQKAEQILTVQQRRGFLPIEEFSLAGTEVSSAHLAQLKDAGAFGDLPDSSQFSLF